MKTKIILLIGIIILSFIAGGCGLVETAATNFSGLVGLNDSATVISERAYIRSSYAVVAADLLEVKRGAKMEILDENEFEKVRWFRVRASDEDNTEGWIEAQHVITGSILEKSKKLAEEDKELQPQAKAELKAASNLRLSPEQKQDNVLLKLHSGASFDVISWKYVLRTEETMADEAKSGGRKPKEKNQEIEAAKEGEQVEELDEKYDIWYKVRISSEVSPAPGGWLFGRQVELQVPSDIAFFQIGATKFVTFQRLDDVVEDEKSVNKEGAKIFKPGSWVILSRSNQVLSSDGNEPDFDGILILGYDKFNQEYYPAYKRGKVYKRSEVTGNIPMKIEGAGDAKTLILKIRDVGGQLIERRFQIFKKDGKLEVIPPPDLSQKTDDEKDKK